MATAKVNTETCIGCGACVAACSQTAIALVDGKASVDAAKCTAAGNCVGACPVQAITLPGGAPTEAPAEEADKGSTEHSCSGCGGSCG